MSTLEIDQAQHLPQPEEDDVECQNERQVVHNFKQLKSFDIVKSALTIFTSSTKLMLLMIFSVIPFFVFMVFFEIKLQKTIVAVPGFLRDPYRVTVIYVEGVGNGSRSVTKIPRVEYGRPDVVLIFNVLQLCMLYLVLYPLLELLSMTTTIKIAAKVYAGEKPNTFKEVFYWENNLKGVLIACGCVQLLSSLTLLGLMWVFLNHRIFSFNFGFSFYSFWPLSIRHCWFILSLGAHTVIFIVLLYKYIDWSAFWNMTMVISVLEEETGLGSFGMTDYYGKHHKPAGFQLMLGFLALNIVLRLPCLYVYGGSSDSSVIGVTSVVIGLVCLANLIKWVAFVLYYFDCKQHTMEKKNDEEIGRVLNVK